MHDPHDFPHMFPSVFELVLWIYPNSVTNLLRCRIPLPFAQPWLRRKWPWLRWKVDASGCGETQPGLVSPRLRMEMWCLFLGVGISMNFETSPEETVTRDDPLGC